MAIIQPSESDPTSGGPAGWGPVPTIGGDVSTSIPDPITGVSPTSTQQTSTATTQAIAQAVFLPPAPTWSPLLDQNGGMTSAWVTWFQTLNRKMGGYTSTPSDDAQILESGSETVDLSARASVDALALFDAPSPQPIASPGIAEMWSDDSGNVRMSGDQRVYGAKTWMGKVGFFGTPAVVKPAALTVSAAAAPAGGTGTAAGGWDTALNRDAAITTINNLRTRVTEIETRLQSLGLLT